jgi:glycosyltransferase involved in cell wall biosynthesis
VDVVARMRDRIAQRGRDGTGLSRTRDHQCTLGHRRWSIIDLSPEAAQPMVNDEGTVVLVSRRVHEQHPFVLRISGSHDPFEVPGVLTEQPTWTLDTEVQLFNTCDIGVDPLVHDEWSKGKCGFKAIEFMACGVPVVASAVGVNCEVIEDGVNFLAANDEEWVSKLGRLLTDPPLCQQSGEAGRRTVETRYSLRVHAPTMADTLRRVPSGFGSREK